MTTNTIQTFAGTGEARHDGDGGPASQAAVFGARAVAFAPDGSLYVMERQGSCIRRIRNGIIETVAGTGARGNAGDGGDARQAVFDAPKEMAVDPDGNIFVVDTESHAIRRIDAKTWIVTTIASGLARPHGALVAPDGSVLVGPVTEPGVHQALDGAGKPLPKLSFASVLDPGESDLARLDMKALQAWFGDATVKQGNGAGGQEPKVPIWTWLIAAAAAAFFFEGVLLRK